MRIRSLVILIIVVVAIIFGALHMRDDGNGGLRTWLASIHGGGGH